MKRTLFTIAVSLAVLMSSLALIVFANPADDPTPSLEINGANISMEDSVHLLYSVGYENIDNPENIKLLIWRYKDGFNISSCVLGTEDAVLSALPGELDEGDAYGKVFKYTGVAAAELTEYVYARAYVEVDGKIIYSDVVKYSVLQYAYNKLGYTGTATENENLKLVLNKMLEYGAAAQMYFFEDEAGALATDPHFKLTLEGTTLPDGTKSGLYPEGSTVSLSKKTTEELPYVCWTDENGRQVSAKDSFDYKVRTHVTLTATLTDELSSFGMYEHVVVVGIDGAGGEFFKQADTPNFDRIFADGAVTYNMRATTPTISAPAWLSFLHGVNPVHHGIVNNTTVETMPYPNDSRYPSFLRVIMENDPDAKTAAIYTWGGIDGSIEDNYGIHKSQASDAAGTQEAANYITNNKDFSALFIHLNDPDYQGHTNGYGGEAYLKEINQVDGQINTIYQALVDAGIADETLFIVTTDHGGSGTSHGNLSDNEKNILFAAKGSTVKAGVEEIEGIEMRDGAAIVLYALGIPQPETYTGTIPAGLFTGVSAIPRPVYHTPEDDRDVVPGITPDEESDEYVTNFVNKNLVTYMPFDGTLTETVGGATVTGYNTVTYEDGYFGQAVKLDDGYLTLDGFDPGTDSFSIAMWMKVPCPYGDSPILANKSWSGRERGFVFAGVRSSNHYAQLNVADGTSRIDIKHDLPEDYTTGWVHVIIIFDRERDQVGYCFDFGELYTSEMRGDSTTDIVESSLTGAYNYLTIGNDATGNYFAKCGLSVDEFMIFSDALTRNDINDLVRYYDKDVVISGTKDIVDNELDIYFDFNGTVKNDGNANVTVTDSGIIYESGVDGTAADFAGSPKGIVKINGYELGKESFSLAFWMKADTTRTSDPILLSTQDWNNGKSQGITIALLGGGNVRVNHADGTNRFSSSSVGSPLPEGYAENWVHVTVVFDRENYQYKVAYNFGSFFTFSIPEALRDKICDGPTGELIIGDDHNGYAQTLGASLDEFMIFNGALDKDDLAAMKAYYEANPIS